jgi:hypothetical protein
VPTIRLDRDDIERFDPPAVCMKCGAPSDMVVRKRFLWTPTTAGGFWWFGLIGLMIAGILALAQSRSVAVNAPLCHQHKNHWSMRRIIYLLGFFAVLFCGALAFIVSAFDLDIFGLDESVFFILAGGAFVAWIILIAVFQSTAIRATEITEYHIILTGVSHSYEEALREEWGYDDDYDRPRRRRRRRDDDDRPRGRRRRYEDEDDDDDRSRRRRRRYESEEDEVPPPKARDRNEGIYDPRKPRGTRGDNDAIQSDDD